MSKETLRKRAFLEYQMELQGVTRTMISELIDVSEQTLRNKLSGKTDFTWSEAQLVRKTYFPDVEYEDLFKLVETRTG